MSDAAEDFVGLEVTLGDQDWRIAWWPPSDAPEGRAHGAAAVCLVDGQVVLISPDGEAWDLPAGRTEPGERWADTRRHEVGGEACATVTDSTLLGFSRGACIRGHELGLVLVRSMWRAKVVLRPWEARFEIKARRLVPAADALDTITRQPQFPDALIPLYRRLFASASSISN
jgi:hypothetical protein